MRYKHIFILFTYKNYQGWSHRDAKGGQNGNQLGAKQQHTNQYHKWSQKGAKVREGTSENILCEARARK